MVNYNPVQTTPFSKKEKVMARLWRFVWCVFYRLSPWMFYKYRVFLLRLFGARVSYKARPANSAFVEYPWNLIMKDYASLGEWSWIYCLDQVCLDEYSCVGQYCKLVSGGHDYKSMEFGMNSAPITLGRGVWLTSEVTVLMGVEIGDYSVVGAKSLVLKNISMNKVAGGIPCKLIGERFDEIK